MTVQRSFRRLPPFPIPSRARWLENLPCDPKISTRGTHPMYYPEFAMCLGPEALGVTGDNTFETLYGREWAVLFCDDNTLHFLQWEGGGEGAPPGLEAGGWAVVVDPLLTLPTFTGAERSFSLAFDQSARIVFAYELAGIIRVTRWDTALGAYVQNVTFAGVDPNLLMDATVVDPRLYPTQASDGWSVRDAYDRGVRVFFQWIPDMQWRETAIPDSDVLLFYLSADRLEVRARTQRELYETPVTLYTHASPLVFDQALPITARYQLLVSEAPGTPLSDVLVSDPYVTQFVISPVASDEFVGGTAADDARVDVLVYRESLVDPLPSTATPETVRVEVVVYREVVADALDSTATAEGIRVEVLVYVEAIADALAATSVAEGVLVEQLIEAVTAAHEMTGAVDAETIRVQAT